MGAQCAPDRYRYLKGVSEALEEDRLCKIRINIMNQEQTGTLRNTMSGSLLIAKNSGFEPKTVMSVQHWELLTFTKLSRRRDIC